MIGMLSPIDIAELKKVAKPTPGYDIFVEPILRIFGVPSHKCIAPDGVTRVSHWKAFQQKLLFNNFFKTLKQFNQSGGLNEEEFLSIAKVIEITPRYSPMNAARVSPALGNLTAWICGHYHLYRARRPYSFSEDEGR
jgi:hypothetical protein